MMDEQTPRSSRVESTTEKMARQDVKDLLSDERITNSDLRKALGEKVIDGFVMAVEGTNDDVKQAGLALLTDVLDILTVLSGRLRVSSLGAEMQDVAIGMRKCLKSRGIIPDNSQR